MRDAKVDEEETKGDTSRGSSFNFALHLARESIVHY